MSKLIYITNASLDGYIEDPTGDMSWVNPDQVHAFITDLIRPIGTHLYGRRLYETMAYWGGPVADYPPEFHDFARVWQAADKIVFSRTLTEVTTPNTRLERAFNAGAIEELKRESRRDSVIGGAELASLAQEADLLDECHVFVNPIVLGGGKPAFRTRSRRGLELVQTRHFETGVVQMHYRMRERRTST